MKVSMSYSIFFMFAYILEYGGYRLSFSYRPIIMLVHKLAGTDEILE